MPSQTPTQAEIEKLIGEMEAADELLAVDGIHITSDDGISPETVSFLLNGNKTLIAYIRSVGSIFEKAEYEVAMGKSVIDQFLTDQMKDALGYCGTGKCGLCPMCRLNNGLNILKFSRLNLPPLK